MSSLESALREPANRVSSRAVPFWRLSAALGGLVVWVGAGLAFFLWPDRPWWGTLGLVAVALVPLGYVTVMPSLRFRIHRWEVTETAVFTRSGWLSREQRIAPLSRVQTVDSHQGALMRLFGLSTITVTTASAAGPIRIDCLDHQVALGVVAELTRITGASEGDAT